MNVLNRLRYNSEGKPYNPLMYPFLLTTFAYGFGFTFFNEAWVSSSSLYMAMFEMRTWMPNVWGAVALTAIVLNVITLMTKHLQVAAAAAFLGAMVWFFAFFVYMLGGDWLIMISVTLPNLLFWIWYYIEFSYWR